MKDSEFFELLNLYVDHEISADDAARLESEVQGNLQRRRVYQQYCRMQKACTLLAKDFVDESADKKVVAFEPRRSGWGPSALAIGGLAVAAACVAFVFVNRPREVAPIAPATMTAAVQPAAPAPAAVETSVQPVQAQNPTAGAIARTVTMPVRRSDFQPVFVSTSLTFAAPNANADQQVATAQDIVQGQYEWMKRLQLSPMQQLPAGDLRIDARSPLQLGSRIYSSGRPGDRELPMSAFQFQK